MLGGEPYTDAKAAVIKQTGSRAVCHYAMVEAGLIGLGCPARAHVDDVHLVTDKIATIEHDKQVGRTGVTVKALFHTTLLAASPKLMINVESGDYAVRSEHECTCGALPAGFKSHLHTIRSYEKLTSEGMNFLGTDLLALVEQVLPAQFGGCSTDYQFIEQERNGLPTVKSGDRSKSRPARPRKGCASGAGIPQTSGPGRDDDGRCMVPNRHPADRKRQSLAVTSGGKIPALQTLPS